MLPFHDSIVDGDHNIARSWWNIFSFSLFALACINLMKEAVIAFLSCAHLNT